MYVVVENKNETVELITRSGYRKKFLPNFDLSFALELLKKFNQIEDVEGKKIFEIWKYKEFFIYPAIQERLFWSFFVQLVKHQHVWNEIRNKAISFKVRSYWCKRGLQTAYQFIHCSNNFLSRLGYNTLAFFSRIRSKQLPRVFIYDDGEDGFRFRKLKTSVKKYASFCRVERLRKDNFFSLLFRKNVFVTGKKELLLSNSPMFNYSKYPFLHEYLTEQEFQLLLSSIHSQCSDIMADCRAMEKKFKKNPPKIILGNDQFDSIIGTIVAAKRENIPIHLFQHGLFTSYHAGWICPGIPSQYCNIRPNILSVWGPYWKKKLLEFSNLYSGNCVEVGVHHNREITYDVKGKTHSRLQHRFCNNQSRKSELQVLFPFEFLTDNIAISSYIRSFLKLGWKVMIKLRPDSKDERDDLAYDEDVRKQVCFVESLTDEQFDQIDVVACTQTTFAYDMMQYLKPIWYLKTPFTFLEQIVEDGIAFEVDMEKLESFKEKKKLEPYLVPKYTIEQFKVIYSDKSLERYVQEVLNGAGI